MVKVAITKLPNGADLELPAYATEDSAGLDLLAAVERDFFLESMERRLIPTGIAIALPKGYEAQVRPRSGLAMKHGITVVNSPGTVDADYRGEIGVILMNLGREVVQIKRGMRIAQMVIAPYSRAEWEEKDSLDETERGTGGFGSTGTHSTGTHG